MNKTLVMIKADSANEMYKNLTQAQALIQLMLDATQEANGSIENGLVNNSMWLLSDLLIASSNELKKREYFRGDQDE